MKKLIKQILKFGVVGVIATIIDVGLYSLLTDLVGIHYAVSQVISFAISLAFNYWASIKWVFDAKKQTPKEALLFIGLSIVGLGINELILWIGIDILGFKKYHLFIKLLATGIVMVFNFITRKLFIEKR